MNAASRHNTRHIVSEIDIQLWAREQRHRWFARRFGALLAKLAPVVAQAVLPAIFAWWHARGRVARQRAGRTIRYR